MTVLPDGSFLIVIKIGGIMPKWKNPNVTFLVIFKHHCGIVSDVLLSCESFIFTRDDADAKMSSKVKRLNTVQSLLGNKDFSSL